MLQVKFGWLVFLVVALVAIGQMTNTIYVPAMGVIAQNLQVRVEYVENLMAFYLMPYGLSQFIYGPLSDCYGRRPIMLFGMTIFLVGTSVVAVADSYTQLLVGSLIQGMGTGVCGMMARTVMRDCYHDYQLQRANSIVAIFFILAPLLAPVLGGLLTSYLGWRSMFYFLLLYGAVVWYLEFWKFPETRPRASKNHFSMVYLKQAYRQVLSNQTFRVYMVCLALTFSGVSVFEATCGILFTHVLHYNLTIAGLLFIIPLPPYMIGCYLAGYLNQFICLSRIMAIAIGIMFVSIILLVLPALLNMINIWLILIPISFFMLGAGIVFPTATTGGTNPLGQYAGTAGAILGGVQNLCAGIMVFLVAFIPQTTQLPLALFLLLMITLIAVIYFKYMRLSDTEN